MPSYPGVPRRPSMKATEFNRLIGHFLASKRASLGMDQLAFAAALSAIIGVEISGDSVANYELSRNTVPAPVLLAAQSLRRSRRRAA